MFDSFLNTPQAVAEILPKSDNSNVIFFNKFGTFSVM